MIKGKTIRIWAGLGALLLLTFLQGCTTAPAPSRNQVALVVLHGDGSVVTRCVDCGDSEITGYDVLTGSGLEVVSVHDSSMGMTICAIDGEGCPESDCFCECKGDPCLYWSYWHLVDGQWQQSQVGAGDSKAHDGDVEGWSWGDEPPGPVVSFEQVCASSS